MWKLRLLKFYRDFVYFKKKEQDKNFYFGLLDRREKTRIYSQEGFVILDQSNL